MQPTEKLEALKDEVREAVEAMLSGTSYYLVDLDVRGWKGTRSVELYLDTEEGVSLEETTELSREIRFVLDTEEVFEDDYTLHVSSPGADRPLSEPRHFRKHVGRKLEITYRTEREDGTTAPTTWVGELLEVGEEGLRMKDPGTEEERVLPHEDVREATVQLPW